MPEALERMNLARADAVRVELALTKEGKAPKEFRLFKFGSNATENGVVVLDEEGARSAIAWAEKYGNKLCVNYNHCGRATVFGPPDPAEAYKAAGWFALAQRDDGLWAESVEWTPKGREKVEAKEYLYTSPEIWMEESTNRLLIVDGCAITNTPATHNLVPLVANRAGAPNPAPVGASPQQGDTPMGIELKVLLSHAGMPAETAEHVALATVADNARAARELLASTGAKTVADALAAAGEGARLVRDLLSATGEKTVAGALGAVDALKADRAKYEALQAQVKKDEARTVAERVKLALDKASQPDESKRVRLSKAERDSIESRWTKDGVAAPTRDDAEWLDGFLKNKTYATQAAVDPPAPNAEKAPGEPGAEVVVEAERATFEGKTWPELPVKTLDRLQKTNPALFDRMRREHYGAARA